MRFSLWLWPYDRWQDSAAMVRAAQAAERLGFASVSVSDHIVCPRGPDAAGVTPVWHDWSVLSTAIACSTTRLRIVSCLVIAYRHPLSVAKQIATIDEVSGGRFTLAAASGWLKPEFDMLRIPHAERADITDEYLRAMRALWTEDEPRFEGRYVSFADIVFQPTCVQKPHVPIWIAGGWAPRPLRRVLELGDGWMPMGGDLDAGLAEQVARIKDDAERAGRDPDLLDFRYTIGIGRAEEALQSISGSIGVAQPTAVGSLESADEVVSAVERFGQAGFTELAINFWGGLRTNASISSSGSGRKWCRRSPPPPSHSVDASRHRRGSVDLEGVIQYDAVDVVCTLPRDEPLPNVGPNRMRIALEGRSVAPASGRDRDEALAVDQGDEPDVRELGQRAAVDTPAEVLRRSAR